MDNAVETVRLPWEQLITVRNNMLAGSDSKIADDMPAATKQLWLDYRQELRDLPATFGHGTANEIRLHGKLSS